MTRILIAGSTGALGRYVTDLLRKRGSEVRALARRPAPLGSAAAEVRSADLTVASSLRGVCDDVSTVFSCAGASMRIGGFRDRRSFLEVDWLGNRNLLAEARRAGVRRFVYVSLWGGERLRHTEYAEAHERFGDELRNSGLDYAIIRPTAFFAFMGELLRMVQRGRGLVLGSGEARVNPVHERDVADACIAAIDGASGEMGVGGRDVFTRRGLVELALEVLDRPVSIRSVRPGAIRLATAPLRLINRRLHALMQFGVEVSQVDVLAPAVGTRSLRDYFTERRHGHGEQQHGGE